MSFRTLQRRVERRERLLDARIERVHGAADSLKRSWRSAWTPGRILIAGLVSGFVAGRAEPMRYAAQSGDLVRLVSLISNVFASFAAGNAAEAAGEARSEARAGAEAGAMKAASAAAAASPDAAASTTAPPAPERMRRE
ncbi:hypothetical protein [Marilutibacter chinensis]|uniref:Protein sip-5 n=1 Tax=Marilutibacter chinensis TaxID=2912247 RepID=A0ABS9HR82_9GAMM|nr:hypothetical protein [Lysobacter chinensis]MCF7221455.1 hypothetical protein [Lysobacter chinensis]